MFVDNYVLAKEEPEGYRRDVSIAFDWDSRYVPGISERMPNGTYEVGIRAVANGERDVDEETLRVDVDNAPETPQGLQAKAEGAGISLAWGTNPEPDILYYVVQRDSGDGYVSVAKRKQPNFYEIGDAGAHLYRVLAVRRSPTVAEGQASLPSKAVRVEVSQDDADDASGGFDAEGRNGAPSGLPSGGLPSLSIANGLPPLPGGSGAGPDRLGDFGERLPYGKTKVPKRFQLTGKETKDTRERWWNVIPPDGLRWVAAGALLLVLSAQARLFAKRLAGMEPKT